jgi:hypothetical protein
MKPEPKYLIGHQFTPRGKHPRLCTITDILRTYNSAGELVDVRYVAEHEFLGQRVTDRSVCETTVAMGTKDAVH